jgi:hypothetical protein
MWNGGSLKIGLGEIQSKSIESQVCFDSIQGNEGNDSITGGLGDDTIDGGSGVDVAIFSGKKSDYSLTNVSSGILIIEDQTKQRDGKDTLSQVERLKFMDVSCALDVSAFPGQAYRIYRAAFDRTPDTTGLGYWITQMDKGMDVVEVASRFIDSTEFRQLYGSNVSNAAFITNVYNNVLDRNPDDTGLTWWVNEMRTNPSKTWQKVLADFSESAENIANVASMIANGITYDPWQ